ncbi:hypothetical protein SUDANB95_07885 (plasmid) [Actinosynnema sp. ALI-1.44]
MTAPHRTTDAVEPRERTLDRLEALVERLGLTSADHLDELVYDLVNDHATDQINGGGLPELDFDQAYEELHDAADARASAINNQCPRDQLAVLLAAYGEDDLTSKLRSLAVPSSPA